MPSKISARNKGAIKYVPLPRDLVNPAFIRAFIWIRVKATVVVQRPIGIIKKAMFVVKPVDKNWV